MCPHSHNGKYRIAYQPFRSLLDCGKSLITPQQTLRGHKTDFTKSLLNTTACTRCSKKDGSHKRPFTYHRKVTLTSSGLYLLLTRSLPTYPGPQCHRRTFTRIKAEAQSVNTLIIKLTLTCKKNVSAPSFFHKQS